MSYYPHRNQNSESNDQEGEIRSSSNSQQQMQLEEGEIQEGQLNQEDQIYDSASSEQDKDRIQQQKKKREDFWKSMNLSNAEVAQNPYNTLENALQAASKTNKRILMLRRKNEKRIEQLENLRMAQQPNLMNMNIHFRSSINDYPTLTIDEGGKKFMHPNMSLRVNQCKLDQFIQKNIAEQSTSNYLNQVVKFENFAYQHRKKRRQNFE